MHFKPSINLEVPALDDQLDAELRRMLVHWPGSAHGRELVRPVDPHADHLRGDPAAAVTVVEYGCLTSRGESEDDTALRMRLQDRIEAGRIRVVFRHFPLIRAHPGASFAARAAEAAARQDGFWQLSDAIAERLALRIHPDQVPTTVRRAAASALKWMADPERRDIHLELQPPSILAIARRVGLDIARLQSDLTHPDVAAKILRDVDTGIRSGVNGTPTFYVQGVRQDVEDAAELIERIERALIGDLTALWLPSHDRVSTSHAHEPRAELASMLSRRRDHTANATGRVVHHG